MKLRNTVLTLVLVALVSLAASAQTNPCNPCAKKAMNPCNPCAMKGGHMFNIDDPMNRNTVTFKSTAPLEDIVGTSNKLSGYIAFDPENPSKAHGKIVVPVASLDTGIPLRDEHLRSADWLNAEKYPNIAFTFEKISDLQKLKESDGSTTWSARLHGTLSIHGVEKQKVVEGRFTHMKESQQTKMRAPGDLIAAKTDFQVALDEFNISGMQGVIGTRVGETVSIDVSFVANTGGAAANPCNPCGGKAANPCNPCGGKKMNPCNPCAKK